MKQCILEINQPMKCFLSILTIFLIGIATWAQPPVKQQLRKALQKDGSQAPKLGGGKGNVTYRLKVVTKDGKSPKAGMLVKAVETSSLNTVKGRTNENGVITLSLENGKAWKISVGKMKNCRFVKAKAQKQIRKRGTLVYDLASYNREKQQIDDRSPKAFDRIDQSHITRETKGEPGKSVLHIKIIHPDKKPLSGIQVEVVSVEDSLIYEQETNAKGWANFVLPINTNYDIDVNGLKNYYFHEFGSERVRQSLKIEFIPTKVNEQEINDTIYQKNAREAEPSSKRAKIKLKVKGNNYEDGELAYLDQLNSNKVYASKINRYGNAYFLIPKATVYLVNFKYQKNVDAINLKHVGEKVKRTVEENYVPDPRLKHPEKFIPSPDKLFLKDFNNFLNTQFERPKDKPFHLKIASALDIHKESREALFTLKLASSDSYGKGVRNPLNIGFILDKSGSMFAEQRAKYLKTALWDVGNQLSPRDRVAVTLFDNEAYPVINNHSDHLTYLERLINNYQPDGGTNIYQGLKKGVKHLSKNASANGPQKIILFTDGYGSQPPKKVTNYVAEKARKGISFSTIGVGQRYNQSLLKLIARKGNGQEYYADSASAITGHFLEEVKDAFNYVVSDLRINIYHNEKMVFSNLYGYPVTDTSKGSISLGIDYLPANKQKLAFLKFKLDEPTPSIENEPVTIKVSYYDMVKEKQVSYQKSIDLKWTEETDTELKMDQAEKRTYAIAILNQTLKNMADAKASAHYVKAKKHLKSGIDQIKAIFPDAKPKKVKSLFQKAEDYIDKLNRVKHD